jgi:hypothetical protein
MRSRSGLLNGLIVSFVTLLMTGTGLALGFVYKPPWDVYSIPSVPKGIVDMVHVDIWSPRLDRTGDVLYVANEEGVVYSNPRFQDEWLVVDPDPHWDDTPTGWTPCTTMPEDLWMITQPPFDGLVVESVGWIDEGALRLNLLCYALLDDGRIQVTVYSDDFSSAMTRVIISAVIGAVVGIVISGLMLRTRQLKEKSDREHSG